MNFGLLLVGLALLTFPALAGSRAGRFPPAEWTRVAALALTLGAVCVYAGLIATTLPPLLHTLQLEGFVGICDPVVHSLMVGGPIVGWTAAVLATIVTASGIQALRRSRRALRVARIEPWFGEHSHEPGYELVVVPTPAMVAMGVPGPEPQVIVSRGLVDELGRDRLHAVIEHEVAHLALRHHRLLVAVAIVERALAFMPLMRRSATAVRQGVEVWADDSAVRSSRATERTLHSALVTVAMKDGRPDDRRSLAAVATRARRLLDPAPCLSAAVRGLSYLPVGGLLCGAAVLAVGWVLSSREMLDLGGYC
jgi:Zn-dependent protease with chaperone function